MLKTAPLIASACCSLVLAPAPAPARQDHPPRPTSPSPGEPADTPRDSEIPGLQAEEPYHIPNLGLSVYLPQDSLVDLSRIEGGRTTVRIVPQPPSKAFVFQIHQSVSADHSLDVSQALRNIIDQRRSMHIARDAQGRSSSLVRVFDEEPDLLIGAHPARRAYLDVPSDAAAPATGYTIFQTGPGQFVIFQMDCAPDVFPKVRTLYELMVASAQFKDPDELGADRAAAILAGQALLHRFNADDRAAAAHGPPAYYRLFRPGPTADDRDASEIGYQRITLFNGAAGDLDPAKPRAKWTTADKLPGTLARVEARAIAGQGPAATLIDSVSSFFLSGDRATELWTVTMVVRRDGSSETWTETGIRRDDRLTVQTTRTGEEPTTSDWSPVPQGYLSRVESYLLPRLVARANIPGAFGFYLYDSNVAKLTLRRETIEPAPTDDPDQPAAFRMTTLPSENSREVVTLLDASGNILRRTMPDGSIMEPIDQPALRKLWADKKLPLE